MRVATLHINMVGCTYYKTNGLDTGRKRLRAFIVYIVVVCVCVCELLWFK